MRVLIIGAGNAGQYLAAKLCEEKHDVVIIDHHPEALEEAQAKLDILTVEGEGSSPEVLASAELQKTDLVVAVTDRDPVNILACALANSAGVPHTVARVSNPDYIHPPKGMELQKLGIDLVVSQKKECAIELFNILRMPGALEAVDLFEGQIMGVGIRVHMDSPLVRAPLREFPQPELLQSIRFIALIRGAELIIPRGDTQFMVGDDIYFVAKPEHISGFLAWAWPEHSSFRKVVIAGGGTLGLNLAQLLETTPMQIVLIERNEERANYCSGILDRALVMKGDAQDQETLESAGIVEETAFVAATGSDENNIIGCLMAEKLGARFTLAQVTRPEYVPIIENLSLLDRTVSPPLSMINAILHFVRGKYVKEAALFHRLPGELLDVVVPAGGKWAGRMIKEIKMPTGVVVASVRRDGEVMVATGDVRLSAGDRLVVFSRPEAVAKLESLFLK
ncbi:MAG: Trk system potassium transporter TrkA [Kiritimatiellae bacterium]|nr:Trk system potassium transporter TrkA [Kiritimatiellia bacterium]